MKVCPKCEGEWPEDCEQSICVEWHNECIACRFTSLGVGSSEGSGAELNAIATESRKRSFAAIVERNNKMIRELT